MSYPRQSAGFTLVELLVVIGIIAVLISILLPALSKARDAANTVKCASALRQVAMAVQLYSQSNNDFVPIAKWNPGANAITWEEHLLPYIAKADATNMSQIDPTMTVMVGCPTWLEKYGWKNTAIFGPDALHYVGYGMNIHPRAPDFLQMDGPPDVTEINWYEPSANARKGRYFKFAQWTRVRPSERAFFGDCRSPFMYYNLNYPLASQTTLDPRHNNSTRLNIVFCDFHTETVLPNDARYAVRLKTP